WSPDHYHHDYLSDPAQPVPLTLRDGICGSCWATHPCTRENPVHTIPAGLQDTAWGSPSSLGGLLATVFICHEALQPAQARA
ncbi:hypothetical protein M9458_032824, partial [Cirrhinus mrigala]